MQGIVLIMTQNIVIARQKGVSICGRNKGKRRRKHFNLRFDTRFIKKNIYIVLNKTRLTE